jgi:hypothetical protein
VRAHQGTHTHNSKRTYDGRRTKENTYQSTARITILNSENMGCVHRLFDLTKRLPHMKRIVVWLGIAAMFACLAIASSLNFLYVALHFHDFWVAKIMGVSTGIGGLYSLTEVIVILEVVGCLVACFAALVDAGVSVQRLRGLWKARRRA